MRYCVQVQCEKQPLAKHYIYASCSTEAIAGLKLTGRDRVIDVCLAPDTSLPEDAYSQRRRTAEGWVPAQRWCDVDDETDTSGETASGPIDNTEWFALAAAEPAGKSLRSLLFPNFLHV